MRQPTRPSRGQVLIIVLLVLVLVGAAAATLSTMLAARSRLSLRQTREVQLVALSDAAFALSLARLAAEPALTAIPEHDFEPGWIGSRLQSLGQGRIQIHTTARIGSSRSETRAVVRLVSGVPVVESWERLRDAALLSQSSVGR